MPLHRVTFRRTPCQVACLLALACLGAAAAAAPGALRLDAGGMAAQALAGATPPLTSAAARRAERAAPPAPVSLSALRLKVVLDVEAQAEGEVQLRQAGLTLTADNLQYLWSTQVATAQGRVRVQRDTGDVLEGDAARMALDTKAGQVEQARYFIARTQAGGEARRVEFEADQRLRAQAATYTSCPRDGSGDPAWLLSADELDLDVERNDGRARGAVLRFLGVPILAAPVLSFPASDQRKSGWLPPSINIDSRSGLDLAVPYYWNLAPNYDATLTPGLMSRRGASFLGEFRYLGPGDEGLLQGHVLPDDQVAERTRQSLRWSHQGRGWDEALRYSLNLQEASDKDYWKDFSRRLPSQTQRLLPQDGQVSWRWTHPGSGRFAETELYARAQAWQVLQTNDAPITAPYQRLPQLGVRHHPAAPVGVGARVENQVNRFVLGDRRAGDVRPDGSRLHLLASLERPADVGWGWLTPRLALNSAAYETDRPMADGRTSARRTIPTFSLDAGLRFERETSWWGSGLRQTLEPRLHYVSTPYRKQDDLPLFDTAASDFHAWSIYSDNGFSGVDRVNDAPQLTVGASTRFLDARSGVERLRLGAAQRYQFREQRLNPDGAPSVSRFSDLLLYANGRPWPECRLDSTVQYSPDNDRVVRSILSARWQPAPFHTLAGTYRYARSLSEQFELGWQWPIYRGQPAASTAGCRGTLYAVGRVNYGMRDSRIIDSLAGLEYDAGCWIGRVVAERTSTGRQEATTRLMIQLELVGLSRLGTNPLKVLKDNIPGYQLLRDDDSPSIAPATAP